MAGINSNYSETSGYLTSKEWESIQQLLAITKNTCNKISAKYKFKVFRDSRWPATGIEIKSGIKSKYIKLSLNPNYLEDKKIFFELREFSVISIPIIYHRTISNRLIATFSEEQLTDKDYIDQNFRALIAEL